MSYLIVGFIAFLILAVGLAAAILLVFFLFYWLPKKLGYPVFAKVLISVVTVALLCTIVITSYNNHFFSKKDAIVLLERHDIVLKDDFKVLNRKRRFGGDNYHCTLELSISERDKEAIINTIRSGANFKSGMEDADTDDVLLTNRKGLQEINFETETRVVKERLEQVRTGEYMLAHYVVTVYKNKNVLKINDLD